MGGATAARPRYLKHLDWLRAYAMILGVPFHIGLIYSVGIPWFVTSPENSVALTWLTGFLTSFRMPLFFMVAGILSAMILEKRDRGIWLKKRFVRLGVPYIFATLTISPVVIMVVAFMDVDQGRAASFWPHFIELLSTPSRNWEGHLWFLKVLLIFSVATFFLQPWMARIQGFVDNRMSDENRRLHMPAILCIVMATIIFRLGNELTFYLIEMKLPVLGTLVDVLSLETIAQFAPYYLIGLFLLNTRLPKLYEHKFMLLTLAVCIFLRGTHWNEPEVSSKLIKYCCGTALAILISFILLEAGERRIRHIRPSTQYLVDSAFTVYLFHYPFCVALGYFLVQTTWNIYFQFVILNVETVAFSVLVHMLISRSATARFLYNGEARKVVQAKAASSN